MEVPLLINEYNYDMNTITNFFTTNLDNFDQYIEFIFDIVSLDNTDEKKFLETDYKYGKVREQIYIYITTDDSNVERIKSYLQKLIKDQIFLSENQFVCQKLVNNKVLEYIKIHIGDLRNLRIYDVSAQGDCGFSVFALKLLFEGKLDQLSFLYDPSKQGFNNYNLESKINTFKSPLGQKTI